MTNFDLVRDIVRNASQRDVVVCLQVRCRFAHVESTHKGQLSQLRRGVSVPDEVLYEPTLLQEEPIQTDKLRVTGSPTLR
jgi:hypothetical protein